jgi:hypothetical protein
MGGITRTLSSSQALRTSVRDGGLGLGRAVPGVGVEVSSFTLHHAAIPARLAPVTDDPGGTGAVKGVLVGPRLQQELLAEAVHAGAAICRWAWATVTILWPTVGFRSNNIPA